MALFLITGGAGFIGSHLVSELLLRGHRVRVMDNFSTGKRENLSAVLDRIDLVEGDICDERAVREALRGVEYVLHQAALASVARSIDNPSETNQVNIQGTLHLLMAARQAKVKRFILAGSSSVYGAGRCLPKRETMKARPVSPYAITKLAGEQYCQVFFHLYRLETVCLRYFNVFGPRQDPGSQYAAVIPRFIKAMLDGKPPVIYGDGEQSRDFTYVSNVVEANILACTAAGVPGHVMNIACGMRHSINTLVAHLRRSLHFQLPARYAEPRPGDVKHSLADISKAKRLLGYLPAVTFEEGLRSTVAWFQKQLAVDS